MSKAKYCFLIKVPQFTLSLNDKLVAGHIRAAIERSAEYSSHIALSPAKPAKSVNFDAVKDVGHTFRIGCLNGSFPSYEKLLSERESEQLFGLALRPVCNVNFPVKKIVWIRIHR